MHCVHAVQCTVYNECCLMPIIVSATQYTDCSVGMTNDFQWSTMWHFCNVLLTSSAERIWRHWLLSNAGSTSTRTFSRPPVSGLRLTSPRRCGPPSSAAAPLPPGVANAAAKSSGQRTTPPLDRYMATESRLAGHNLNLCISDDQQATAKISFTTSLSVLDFPY